MVKKIILFIGISFICKLQAQSNQFTNFFGHNWAYDACFGLENGNNNEIIALHTLTNFPENAIGWYLSPIPLFQTPNRTFTMLKVFSSNGDLLRIINFPDTDSLYHYGFRMERLPNNKFVVSGEVAYPLNNNRYKVFMAIIDDNYTEIESIYYFGTPNGVEWFKSMDVDEQGNIYINYERQSSSKQDNLIKVNQNGQILNSQYYYNGGFCSTGENTYNGFIFNNYFYNNYGDCGFNFLKFDSNVNIVWYDTTISGYLHLASKGKVYNDSTYIINEAGSKVYQLFENDSLYTFFEDSNPIGFIGLLDGLDYYNKNHIYIGASYKIDTTNYGVYIRSVNSLGQLNWSKQINIHNEGFGTINSWDIFQQLLATSDNGCLITFAVDDSVGYADCYALKLDSNGNQVDIFTGLFDRKPSINISDFILYPNPSNSLVNISTYLKDDYTIDWFTLDGRRISSINFNQKAQFDFTIYPSQILFYTIKNKMGKVIDSGQLKID